MKYCIKICSLFFLLSILGSCKKVITLDLGSVPPKYVIEGTITDSVGTAQVLISQTKDFYSNNNFIGITGAIVTVTDDSGVVTTFVATDSGVYQSATLVGQQNHSYTLNVNIAGQLFSAVSTMPVKVPFDSLFITTDASFGSSKKVANVQYKDPLGKGNSYRFVEYINGIEQQTIYAGNDDYTDGNKVTIELNNFGADDTTTYNKKIVSGDSVKVDMQCIDKSVYEYWYSLDQSATGSSQSAAPGNPVTNMQGGALGYFSANTLQTKSVVAP
ncbi:MAG TPA: DUF4249 domain-containing protein [Ferruginibacter sp.]|jgi:hypothetical protein|nr:DUF4249 domain-containing protein [Ferruginibacter sp.]